MLFQKHVVRTKFDIYVFILLKRLLTLNHACGVYYSFSLNEYDCALLGPKVHDLFVVICESMFITIHNLNIPDLIIELYAFYVFS